VGLIPNGSSQQFTTSTTFLTGTSYVTGFSYVTSAGLRTQTEAISFTGLGGCGKVGLEAGFEASGITHFDYSASGPMQLYVVDAPTLIQWSSGPLGWIACAPSSGNWVRYSLGNGSPLSGSFNLNLPSNTYYIVCVAAYGSPTASVVEGPVLVPQTETIPYSKPTTFTITSVSVLQVSVAQSYGSWLLVFGVIVIIGIVLLFLVRRNRSKEAATQSSQPMALDGQTSADKAGIKVKGENKWVPLIQNASQKYGMSSNTHTHDNNE
jgi:hypothetical protein